MNLSAEQWNEIKELEERKDEFPYAGNGLGQKNVTMLLGGIGFGKSTIVKEIGRLPKSRRRTFRENGTVTTRGRKTEDPDWYRTADEGVTYESFIKQVYAGEMINWSLLHETGHLYGSDKQSFRTRNTLMPVLPDSMPQVAKAGFHAVRAVYIMPDPTDWYRSFQPRIEAGDARLYMRLQEARESVEYAMGTQEQGVAIARFVNRHDPARLRLLAETVLSIGEEPIDYEAYATLGENFDAHAATMHTMISELITSGPKGKQE